MSDDRQMAIKKAFAGECNGCGAWAEMLTGHRRCPACHAKWIAALEHLREIASMYRERLPAEVVEALEVLD